MTARRKESTRASGSPASRLREPKPRVDEPKRAKPGSASPAPRKRASTAARDSRGGAPSGRRPSEVYQLRLYVAGQTARSVQAFANLERICEEHLQGQYRIEVIDLLKNPTLARGDQILAVPTLVRLLPPPVKKIIGDFSNTERVLVGLNLVPLRPRRSG